MRKSKNTTASARKVLAMVADEKYNAMRLCLTGLPTKSAPASGNFCTAKPLTDTKKG